MNTRRDKNFSSTKSSDDSCEPLQHLGAGGDLVPLPRAELNGSRFIQPRRTLGSTGLAPIDSSYGPLFAAWLNDETVCLPMGDLDSLPFGAADGVDYAERHRKDTWLIVRLDAERLWLPIVYTGMFVRSRRRVGVIRIAIGDRASRHQGHAFRAMTLMLDWGFHELDLCSIHLRVSSSNAEALHLYEKIGFRVCGRFQGSRLEKGRRYDEILMELPCQEWNLPA